MSLDQLIKIFEDSLDVIPQHTLNGTTEYKKLKAWDSLGVLMIVDAIEMEFGVLILKQDFDAVGSIAELHTLIQRKVSGGQK